MKLHVYDIKTVNDRVYVSGVRKRTIDGKWKTIPVETSFNKDYFNEKVKSAKFPIVFDIKFVKGIGAQFNE